MEKQYSLQSIKISGFRSIQAVDLPIHDLNVLIGQNGAGKSNFIEVFRFLYEILNQRLQIYTAVKSGADKLLHYGRRETKSIFIGLRFPPNHYSVKLIPTDADRMIIERENVYFDTDWKSNGRYEETIANGSDESNLNAFAKNAGGVSKYVVDVLKDWRVYHFHDTSAEAPVKKMGDITDTAFLRADAGNLAAFLWYMQQKSPKHYSRLVGTVQLVLPFFKDFVFRPNPYNEQKILLEWQDNKSDIRFNAGDLSDGSLRFICLAALLLQPKLPSTLPI